MKSTIERHEWPGKGTFPLPKRNVYAVRAGHPPYIWYHGTSFRILGTIQTGGLHPGTPHTVRRKSYRKDSEGWLYL